MNNIGKITSHTSHPVYNGRWLACLLMVLSGLAWAATSLQGQVLYWDNNKKTAGAGSTPTGTWSASNKDKYWTTNSAGTVNPIGWTSDRDAVFSAGTDATGAFTVTVSGTQNVSSITVQEGSPTFNSGTINFSDSTPDFTIASGSTATFGTTSLTSSTGNLNFGGGGVLNLTASLNLGGMLTFSGGTLRLTDADLVANTLNITANSIIDFTGSASSMSLANLVLGSGVTLTILNWIETVDFFYSAAWTGAVRDTMGSAPMNQVLFSGSGYDADRTGWDSYDNQIRPNVPEPWAYGAILVAASLALLVWQRRSPVLN